jgi:hypothetical protein
VRPFDIDLRVWNGDFGPDMVGPLALDLGVEVEEGVDTQLQLRLNLFPAALEHVHRAVRLIAVLQGKCCVAHRRQLLGRQ